MKKIFLLASIFTITIYSCKDDEIIDNLEFNSTQSAQDHLLAEQIFNEVGALVEEAFAENGISKSCAKYIRLNDNATDQDTLVIDFGTNNCVHNKHLRNGKIIITYTAKYRDSTSIITTTFDNYHYDNRLIEGERIVKNQGRNDQGNMWFTISVNNATITTTEGSINWGSITEREWLTGDTSILNTFDDSYSVTGEASGKGLNNIPFKMTITKPLIIDLSCLPTCVIKSGITTLSPTGYTDRIINYGDSICDCKVDVTINGTTYPIENNN